MLAGSLLASVVIGARGDATVYWDFDNGFVPAQVVIGPGETVTWWNVDVYGFAENVTFNNGFSFPLPNLHGQAVVFPSQTGVYGYHGDYGDSGAVIVDLPPAITITNPPDHAVLPAPATFMVGAEVSDTADDYVADVQFWLGTGDSTNYLADVYGEPFVTTVSDLAAGTYQIIAVAMDSHGLLATNAVTITVGAETRIDLLSPRISGGRFLFDATGLATGKTNVLLMSSNLESWQPVATNLAASASLTVTNSLSSSPHFYRLLQLP